MKKAFFLALFFLFIISCNTTYQPYKSRKDKHQSKRFIKKSFKFSNIEYEKIVENDSVSYSILKSLNNDKIHKNKIRKRLDSFFAGKYDQKKLLFIMELDRSFPDMDFEFEKDDGRKRLNFSNIKDLKKFMNKIDSSFVIDGKVLPDSTKQKKQ